MKPPTIPKGQEELVLFNSTAKGNYRITIDFDLIEVVAKNNRFKKGDALKKYLFKLFTNAIASSMIDDLKKTDTCIVFRISSDKGRTYLINDQTGELQHNKW